VTSEHTLRAFIDNTLGDATPFSDPGGGDIKSQLQLGGLGDMDGKNERQQISLILLHG